MGVLELEYRLYRSHRKTLSIEINDDGLVIVRSPHKLSISQINDFLRQKYNWIAKHLQSSEEKRVLPLILPEQKSRMEQSLLSRIYLFEEKLKQMAYQGPFPTSYRLNTAKRQWGNCKNSGVVTFNRYAYFLPDDILWYLFVHEISHLREMNHGPNFWSNVSMLEPRYLELRQQLKEYRVPHGMQH